MIETHFEQLLTALHPDRDRAGMQYRRLHQRLCVFFECRNSPLADEQADLVIDRLLRRIAEGQEIRDLQSYALGVAKLLLLESRKRAVREQMAHAELLALASDVEHPAERHDAEERHTRFERCLAELSDQNRAIILAYYTGEGSMKIDARRRLADELGMDLNALRVRAHRIRARLERCLED